MELLSTSCPCTEHQLPRRDPRDSPGALGPCWAWDTWGLGDVVRRWERRESLR